MDLLAYCRYSSEAQRDGYSIEAQVRAITEWAEREGHTIRKFYIDEARSGTNDEREEFQHMIADAVNGVYKDIKGVVVHKLDRFARDRYDSAVYRHKLKQVGIRVISVLEPLDDSPESVMMEAVLEGMAEYYSRNLSREVKKGQKEAALNTQHVAGPVPYGYRVDEALHYIPIAEEAANVREIFRQLNAGFTPTEVVRWADEQGIKTRRGKRLTTVTLLAMIRNPIYMGKYVFGQNYEGGPIVKDDAVPAIVDAGVFLKVNEAADRRKKGPRARFKEDDYLLTGLLYCAYCGAHLFGFKSHQEYTTKDGERRVYEKRSYRCSRAKKGNRYERIEPSIDPKRCTLKSLPKERLEEFVLEALKRVLFTGESVRWIVAKLNDKLEERKQRDRVDTSELKVEHDKIKMQQERLLDLYLSGDMPKPAYTTKAHELEARESFLADEIKRLSAPYPRRINADKMEKALAEFNNSANADSPEYKKRLLHTFVEGVAVSNEKLVIYFKFPIPGAGDSIEQSLGDISVRKGNQSLH